MDLTKRMTDVVTHIPALSKDTYGDTISGLPTTYPCVKQGKHVVIRTLEGEEVSSTLQFYIVGNVKVTRDDEVTFLEVTYPVTAFENFKGHKPGMDLTVVYA